jgi:hypothetical protein
LIFVIPYIFSDIPLAAGKSRTVNLDKSKNEEDKSQGAHGDVDVDGITFESIFFRLVGNFFIALKLK